MIIFEGKYLNYQWTRNKIPGTYYGMSGKGWMDQKLFRHWLKDHFLKYAVASRLLLLLMDGHSSHYESSSVELAKENDVILFCLPPHTTQDSQTLDCTVFGPLKHHWSNVCHKYSKIILVPSLASTIFVKSFQKHGYLPSHLPMLSLDFVSVGFIHLIVMPSQLKVEDLKYLTQKFYRRNKVMTVLTMLTR